MKEPPESTPEQRDAMRTCIYSQIRSDTVNPDYRCTHKWRHNGEYCLLYRADCMKREQFPDSQDT